MEITIDTIIHQLPGILASDPLDLSCLSWIEPIGLSLIKAFKRYNPDLRITLPQDEKVRKYIHIMNQDIDSVHGNTYVPLISLPPHSRDKVDRTAREIVDKLLKDPSFEKTDDDYANDCRIYLSYMLTEVLNNAVDHANSAVDVIVCAQHFPKKKKTQVSIVDCGVGFKATLSGKYQVHNEADALSKAIQREVTGAILGMYQSTTRNIGMGLYVLTEMIKHLNGQLLMFSRNGFLTMKDRRISIGQLETEWPGSLVAFEIDTQEINHDFNDFMRIYILQKEEDEEDIF